MVRFIAYLALLAAAFAYAMARGGKPEKQVAAVLVGMLVLDNAYHAFGANSDYVGVDTFHAFNDFWSLIAITAIALAADRFWPLWVAALQTIAASSHYVRWAEIEVLPIVYAIMNRLPSWLMVIVLLLGTWNYSRQKRRAASSILPPY